VSAASVSDLGLRSLLYICAVYIWCIYASSDFCSGETACHSLQESCVSDTGVLCCFVFYLFIFVVSFFLSLFTSRASWSWAYILSKAQRTDTRATPFLPSPWGYNRTGDDDEHLRVCVVCFSNKIITRLVHPPFDIIQVPGRLLFFLLSFSLFRSLAVKQLARPASLALREQVCPIRRTLAAEERMMFFCYVYKVLLSLRFGLWCPSTRLSVRKQKRSATRAELNFASLVMRCLKSITQINFEQCVCGLPF